jgi:hypothetical protein
LYQKIEGVGKNMFLDLENIVFLLVVLLAAFWVKREIQTITF